MFPSAGGSQAVPWTGLFLVHHQRSAMQRHVQAAARIQEPKADTGFPAGTLTGVVVIEATTSLHPHIQ